LYLIFNFLAMEYTKQLLSGIHLWPEEDRPREKLVLKGKYALSDAELIAILIGSGTVAVSAVELGRKILSEANNDLNQLATLSVKDLERFKGIGRAKAITIVSALELGRRRKETPRKRRHRIGAAADVHEIMKEHLGDLDHEQFWAILLNRANEVIRKVLVSQGGVSGTYVDPKLIFKPALESLACAVILVHNHPSGNQNPSPADHMLTKKLKDAGKMLDVSVLDHIIFTDQGFYSFADEGKI